MTERQIIVNAQGYVYEAYVHSGLICIRQIKPSTGHFMFSRKLECKPGFWQNGMDLEEFVEELDGVLYSLKITKLKHNLKAGAWTCRWRPPNGRH